MAAPLETAIKFTTKFEGQGLDALKRNLQGLSQQGQTSKRSLDQLYSATKALGAGAGNSIVGLQRQTAALKILRENAEIGSRKFQLLTRDIAQLETRLQGLTRVSATAGKSLDFRGAVGSAAGTVAMGGGPGAALGALGGSLAAGGGPIGLAAAGGLAATAGLAMQSVGNARALEEQTRRLRVMTTEGDALQKQIIALSREQGHLTSTTEATAAAYDILQAGFSNSSEILNILKASTLGAVGGFTDVKTVADATTSILNGYGLSASEAGRIVDQMKASTDDGKISMEAYAQSIGRVVPSAAAAKLPLEEINAAISSLTAQGVPVETTFSGINQAIKTILKPTQEARELAKALGLEFNAQALAAKGLGGFLADVSAKTGKSSDALSILFSDIDGYKAVIGLLNDDLQRFNQFTDNQANAIGRSAAAAETAIDPLKRFDNAWKDLTSTLGQLVLPAITNIVNGTTKVLQALMSMPQWLKEVGKWATILTNQLTPFGSALNGLAWFGRDNQNQPSNAVQPSAAQPAPMPRGGTTPAQAATAARASALAAQLLDGSGGRRSQEISIVDLGKRLQALGFTVKEHPAFGGVGRHAENSHHYYGEALDVTDWRSGDWRGRTADLVSQLRRSGAGFAELLGPGDPGHSEHGHLAASGGKVKLTPKLASILRIPYGENASQTLQGANSVFDQQQQAQKAADDDAAELRKITNDQLVISRERLAVAENSLRVTEAQTDEQRVQAEFDAARSDRITRNATLLRDSLSVEERGNILKAQYREGLAAEMELEKKLKEIRQQSYEDAIALREEQLAAITEMGDAMGTKAFSTPDIQAPGSEFKPFAGYVEGIGTMNDALNNLATTGFKGIEDAMVSLATTGKANFREFAAAMLEDTARIIIQQMVLKTILSAIGGIGGGGSNFSGIPGFNPATGSLAGDGFSGFNPGAFTMPALSSGFAFAKGGAFSRNGIVPFARGGIVNNPTLFRFANGGSFGTGMMGEAGPEAIIPLKRGRDGRLGVSGGGDVSVSVQVNAGGTPAENDGSKARELGQVVAQAVKAEIVRQKRPGGILS